MAMDGQGHIWAGETGMSPNLFAGFDTQAEKIFSITAISSGGGAVRNMHYHVATESIWIGTDKVTLGRALVGDAG